MFHIRVYGDCDRVVVNSPEIHQVTLISGAAEDQEFRVLCAVRPHMIEYDESSMDPTVNGVSDLGEVIIQVGDAESLVDEMVFSSDQHMASMNGHSGVIGTDDCLLGCL